MDLSLVWRAGLAQALAVAALFALFLALPVSEQFFRDYGAAVGPASWLACALIAGRALSLRISSALRAAVVSGAVAGAIGILVDHTAGLVAGIAAFGLVAGAYGRGEEQPTPSPAGSTR